MKDLRSLFHASPDTCFEEIGIVLQNLDSRMRGIEQRLDSITDLYEQFLKNMLPVAQTPPMTSWIYDVRMPNTYFDSIYDPEIYPQFVKRWVNGTAKLATRLAMPRNRQYRFQIKIVEFTSPEAEATFKLTVEGDPVAWLSTEDNLFTTIIPELSGDSFTGFDTLSFALECDRETCQNDVSFSFQHISISAV